MTSSLFPSFDLLKNLPLSRPAFSNRTAWIMAVMSALAYRPLPEEISLTEIVEQIKDAAAKNGSSEIRELVLRYHQSESMPSCELLSELDRAGFSFLQGFHSESGTQAFLARLNGTSIRQPILILAFRGTQTTEFQDIKTDADVGLQPAPRGGRVHPGFLKAFISVEAEIQAALDQFGELPLYVTGHSLGGALAIVATRYLRYAQWAATYTFGGPRVADDAFFEDFRTPVYRVVNGADVVARLPFGEAVSILLGLIRMIPINGTFAVAEWLRSKLVGYTHPVYGGSIYLSDSINTAPDVNGIPYGDLQVRQDPEFVWRVRLVVTRFLRGGYTAFVGDHSISLYAEKLYANAKRRCT